MKQLVLGLFLFSLGHLPAYAQPCQTSKLDPRVAVALRTVLADLPSSPTTSVEQIRDVRIPTPAFPQADMRHLRVTADSIPIQVYNPAYATGLPIIISYHPGGFVTPILPFMEYEFWRQAKTYNAIVFAVDYRVAPEHRFPAAVDDAYGAFRWVVQNGQRYGGDTSRIVVLGLSAGGNLAAVVCQKAQAEGLANAIKLQILNCPSTDHPRNAARHPSYQRYATGYFQTKAFCEFSIRTYAPNATTNNPDVAPLQRNRLAGLPPALILTAEFDPLRDEGYAYAERLRIAGVPVQYRCFAGQIHCLLGLPADAGELDELDQLVIDTMHKTWRTK